MYPDIVVVSGCSKGFGKELCIDLLEQNISVLGFSRTKPDIKDINFVWWPLDISDLYITEETIATLVKWINPGSKIGIVLSAATLGTFGGLLDSDLQDWELIYKTNVLGNLAVLQGFLPYMINSKYGRIIFLAGGGSAYGYPLFSGYSLSKTAIVRAVENLSMELEGKGNFSTVALAPGAMETSMLEMVKAVGGEVKTTVDISEPIEFVKEFFQSVNSKRLDGRFIHVRDNWKKYLDEDIPVENYKWLLRRTE